MTTSSTPEPPDGAVVGLTALQKVTIQNLETSRDTTVPASLFAEVPAAGLRAAVAAAPGVRTTAILAHELVGALVRHPELNTTLAEGELHRHASVSLGVAVALDTGELMVPVLHGADSHSLPDLAAAIDDLVGRARNRDLRLPEVRGGVFTLSNIGPFAAGITATPVLPAGHTGVLLVSAPVPRPVVREGALAIAEVMPVALTFDHRVVNGVAALAFLNDVLAAFAAPGAFPTHGDDPCTS